MENLSCNDVADVIADNDELTCPHCKDKLIEWDWGWSCSDGCGFKVNKNICGATITESFLRDLFLNEISAPLEFYSEKKQKKFKSKLCLRYNSKGVLEVSFLENKAIGDCPCCKSGVFENQTKKGIVWSCSNPDCKFAIWKNFCGVDLALEDVKSLLETGKSKVINGFLSKKGNTFSSKLILGEDHKVSFLLNK